MKWVTGEVVFSVAVADIPVIFLIELRNGTRPVKHRQRDENYDTARNRCMQID